MLLYSGKLVTAAVICSNIRIKTKQLSDLENAMNQLEGENSAFKTRIEGLQKQTQQLEEQLGNLNSAIDFIWLTDIIRYVSAKCPTKEEMFDYLKKRQIVPAILKRAELACLTYSQQTGRWHFLPEYDVYQIST